MYYLEGEFSRGARSDGTERAPEVDGGGKRTGSQQDRSLDQQMHKNSSDLKELLVVTDRQTDRQTDKQVFTRAWEVMTVGVSVFVADPGANKLLTAAFTCRGNRI